MAEGNSGNENDTRSKVTGGAQEDGPKPPNNDQFDPNRKFIIALQAG